MLGERGEKESENGTFLGGGGTSLPREKEFSRKDQRREGGRVCALRGGKPASEGSTSVRERKKKKKREISFSERKGKGKGGRRILYLGEEKSLGICFEKGKA